MDDALNKLRVEFDSEVKAVTSLTDVENLKIKFLGKKSPLQDLMRSLKDVSQDERPKVGQQINTLKEYMTQKCQAIFEHHQNQAEKDILQNQRVDVTLPGRRNYVGRSHPIRQILNHCLAIFKEMGFSVQVGPNVDSEYYNFGSLNFEDDHPARDMQDTFYLSKDMLLRTHTSNIQARLMEQEKPPIRAVCPGKVFRNEDISARSHVFFHQIDGFYINENVSFSDLISTLKTFFSKLFMREIKMRFRSSYFPFVEPGLEADIECLLCSANGCPICKHSGWLEVVGAGMIHPNVLKAGKIDPEKYSGFAWGFGIERLKILIDNIPDIRLFTQNDIRFLSQF